MSASRPTRILQSALILCAGVAALPAFAADCPDTNMMAQRRAYLVEQGEREAASWDERRVLSTIWDKAESRTDRPVPTEFAWTWERNPKGRLREAVIAPKPLTAEAIEDPKAKMYFFPADRIQVPLVADAMKAVVRFEGGGVGFLIDGDGTVATIPHVVNLYEDADGRIEGVLRTFEGERFPFTGADVIRYDKVQLDRAKVALLRVAALKGRPHLEFSPAPPAPGQKVFLIGAPVLTERQAYQEGDRGAGVAADTPLMASVGSVFCESGLDSLVPIDALGTSGNSGSPIMDLSGKVVALFRSTTSSSLGTLPYRGVGVSSTAILTALAGPKTPTNGAVVRRAPDLPERPAIDWAESSRPRAP